MKRFKNVIVLILALVFALTLVACGENEKTATPDESTTVQETTVVIETTAEGGTIEKDSEGNTITKDENGKVVSVEDKDGNPVDVVEYVTTHTWIESDRTSSGQPSGSSTGGSGSSGKGGSNSGNGSSGNGGSGGSGGSSGTSSSGQKETVSSNADGVEEDIPVIVVSIPDYDDLEELPDL